MVAAMINARVFICVGIVLITVFVPLFFCEFVKVLKNKRSNVSLIFKARSWVNRNLIILNYVLFFFFFFEMIRCCDYSR